MGSVYCLLRILVVFDGVVYCVGVGFVFVSLLKRSSLETHF